MIQSQNLRFSYNSQVSFSFPDFSCAKGDTLLVLGNSGKGKTTFLHLLALLLKAEAGEIVLDQENLTSLSVADSAKLRSQKIGVIYQRPHFVSALSVKDNLLMANYLANKKLSIERLQELSEMLGIANLLNKKTSECSLGEQQRIGIARALMNRPSLILADEPTSSLDDENCEKVIELLKNQVVDANASLIIVTHDQRLKNHFKNQILLS